MAVDNFGAWQDKVVVPKVNCVTVPKNLTLQEAAAIPVNYLTASIMLFDMAVLKPKQSVFVHMAAGVFSLEIRLSAQQLSGFSYVSWVLFCRMLLKS